MKSKGHNTDTLKIDPKVKDILILLGAGTFLAASILMPGLPLLAKPFIDNKRLKERNEWKKFNTWRLRQVLKRLNQQKLVEIYSGKDDRPTIKITEKGKRRLLKFDIDNIHLNQHHWDRKWRIIIYDIFSSKESERQLFRKALKKLQFIKLQRSVYLTPFSCTDQIEYLRQACNVSSEVLILTVSGLENEEAYKEYFGLL